MGREGTVLEHAEPAALQQMVEQSLAVVADRTPEHQIVFLKSWNEWAEGNYLEPDAESGRSRLEAVAEGVATHRRRRLTSPPP